MDVKCNKCGHVADESEFPKGTDFLQNPYVKACPACDNRQSPADASLRMFGGKRPFVYVRRAEPSMDMAGPYPVVIHRAQEAS